MNTTSDPLSGSPLSTIAAVLEWMRYTAATVTVLVIYDFLLTLDDEVWLIFLSLAYFVHLTAYSQIRLVWPGPLSFAKVLYYINRYLSIVGITFSNYR
jgi:hypothetical protein